MARWWALTTRLRPRCSEALRTTCKLRRLFSGIESGMRMVVHNRHRRKFHWNRVSAEKFRRRTLERCERVLTDRKKHKHACQICSKLEGSSPTKTSYCRHSLHAKTTTHTMADTSSFRRKMTGKITCETENYRILIWYNHKKSSNYFQPKRRKIAWQKTWSMICQCPFSTGSSKKKNSRC